MLEKPICALFRTFGKYRGSERLANLILPQRCFPVDRKELLRLEGTKISIFPRSRIGWNLYVFGTYETQLRRILKDTLRPGAVVIDAGANVGWHTLLAAQLVGKAGAVHSFEPNPFIRSELTANVERNELMNVKVWETALSDRRGTATFNAPQAYSYWAGCGSLQDSSDEPEFSLVECSTDRLDSLDLALTRLDFIKIDVEGHEAPLLRGAIETITRFRPAIAFEYLSRDDQDGAAISEMLFSIGYDFYAYDNRRAPHRISDLSGYSGDVLAKPLPVAKSS